VNRHFGEHVPNEGNIVEGEDWVVEEEYATSGDEKSYEAAPGVVIIHEPASVASEAIGALRTHLVTQEIGNGLGALAICGPSRSSGSTFVLVNLAVALSQIGIRTLLIDADMREPGVDQMILPPRPLPGLQQCLTGEVAFADAIQQDVLPNLSILFSGGSAPNPQELLSGATFREILDFCARDYDLALLDTPPANQSADGRYIAAVAGAALVVARKHHSLVSDVTTLAQELERNESRVIGTVLNDF
jgi:receptor protein-tyrosine kinase